MPPLILLYDHKVDIPESIRKYTDEQIGREDLEKILEAGNYAPNAGGGQRSMMVAIHNRELTGKLGVMNLAKFNRGNLVGYIDGEQPVSKPRKPGRVQIIE